MEMLRTGGLVLRRRYHDTHKRFPHLANCLKYCMSFTVALFGVFTPPHSTTTAVKVGRNGTLRG